MVKKITIIDSKPFSIERQEGGDPITGFNLQGFLADGKAIKFSSSRDHDIVDAVGFDKNLAEDIDLKVKIWDGKAKFREIDPE